MHLQGDGAWEPKEKACKRAMQRGGSGSGCAKTGGASSQPSGGAKPCDSGGDDQDAGGSSDAEPFSASEQPAALRDDADNAAEVRQCHLNVPSDKASAGAACAPVPATPCQWALLLDAALQQA